MMARGALASCIAFAALVGAACAASLRAGGALAARSGADAGADDGAEGAGGGGLATHAGADAGADADVAAVVAGKASAAGAVAFNDIVVPATATSVLYAFFASRAQEQTLKELNPTLAFLTQIAFPPLSFTVDENGQGVATAPLLVTKYDTNAKGRTSRPRSA
jgi:hypothetical protein